MSSSEFKPSKVFLAKVEAGYVRITLSYTRRKGAVYRYVGGESSINAHRRAGYIHPLGAPDLGRPCIARLTDKGRDWLAARTRRTEQDGE